MMSTTVDDHQARADGLSPQAWDAVKATLGADERVLWAGRSVPGAAWGDMMPAMQSRWARIVLYSIVSSFAFCLLAWFLLILIVGIGSDIQKGHFGVWNTIMTLLFLPILLLIGGKLVLLIVYPWLSIRRARHRSYVLTDRRALTALESPDGVKLSQVELGTVEAPSLARLRKDGVGDIIFGGFVVRSYTGDGGMDIDTHYETGFTACPEAKRVMALFTEARQRRRQTYEREVIEEMGRDYQGWLRRNGQL